MSALEQIAAFTYRRQLLGKAGHDPLATLAQIVGVYSSHPSAPLSLRARVSDLQAAAFTRLDEDKLAIRINGPRGSIHLVPRENAERVAGVFSDFSVHDRSTFKYFKIDERDVAGLQEKVLERAFQPVTASDLKAVTGLAEGTNAIVGSLTRAGKLLRLAAPGLRSNALRYVRTEAWLGAPLARADPRQAQAWLAEQYLNAWGPVRRADFKWWSGLSASDADTAIAALRTKDVGDGLLLLADDETAFQTTEPIDTATVDLLPKWDMLAMGYPAGGRERFLDSKFADRAYDFRGDSIPQVLLGGRAQAAWTMKAQGKKLAITIDWFVKPAAASRRAVQAEFGELAGFLGVGGVVFS